MQSQKGDGVAAHIFMFGGNKETQSLTTKMTDAVDTEKSRSRRYKPIAAETKVKAANTTDRTSPF